MMKIEDTPGQQPCQGASRRALAIIQDIVAFSWHLRIRSSLGLEILDPNRPVAVEEATTHASLGRAKPAGDDAAHRALPTLASPREHACPSSGAMRHWVQLTRSTAIPPRGMEGPC